MKPRVHAVSLVVAVMLMTAACSDSDGATATTTARPADTTTPPTSVTPATQPTSTTTAAAATTLAPTTTVASTTTEPAPTTTGLPGEPSEHPFFREGDMLGVVGVAFDDVLNLRAAPGIDQEIVATLDPLEEDVTVIGPARSLPASLWIEVGVTGARGWVNSGFLAYLDSTFDTTSRVIADLGEIPQAETMLELGAVVAALEAAISDEEISPTITVTAEPTVGDLGGVTYDVFGCCDDSVMGVRLHVFGRPLESGEGFELKSVESTVICWRGVTADGLCI